MSFGAAHLSGRRAGTEFVVDNGHNELRDTAENHSSGQEEASASPTGDDGAVYHDCNDTDGSENAGVLERRPNRSHFEEICSIGYILVSIINTGLESGGTYKSCT